MRHDLCFDKHIGISRVFFTNYREVTHWWATQYFVGRESPSFSRYWPRQERGEYPDRLDIGHDKEIKDLKRELETANEIGKRKKRRLYSIPKRVFLIQCQLELVNEKSSIFILKFSSLSCATKY